MNKLLLQQQVCNRLEADLASLIAAAEAAHQAATHEESKAENKYDTRGLEASYLAAGQSRRVAEIRRALSAWRALQIRPYDDSLGIQLGALVCLEDTSGRRQRLLLGPDGAGLKLHDGQGEVLLISPHAPLGQKLQGQGPGDWVQVGQIRWQVLQAD